MNKRVDRTKTCDRRWDGNITDQLRLLALLDAQEVQGKRAILPADIHPVIACSTEKEREENE